MPLYEYRCESCHNLIEVLQKFSDAPLTTCAKCGGSLERLISTVGLHFKGTGFYLTDYGRAGSDARSGNGEKSEKTETKRESKPEKSEPKTEKTASTAPKPDKT